MSEDLSTRDRIVEASTALFRSQGAVGTGLKQITNASGAPWGSLYHYFPDGKDQLIAEAIRRAGDHYAEAMRKAFAKSDTPAAAVRRYFEAAARNLTNSDFADGCPIGTVTLEVASTNDALRAVCAEVFAMLARTVADGLEAAGIDRESSRQFADQFLVGLEGALVLSRARRDAAPLRHAGALLAAAVEAATAKPTDRTATAPGRPRGRGR